jgi:hypothetical protein
MNGEIALTMMFEPGHMPTADELLELYGHGMISAEVRDHVVDLVVAPVGSQDYADVIDKIGETVIKVYPEARILQ